MFEAGAAAAPKKQIHIEALRGLAAWVVVATHFAMAFYPAAAFGSVYRAHGSGERLFVATPLGLVLAGQSAVCLFFILSGYVLSLGFFGPRAKDANQLLAAAVKRPFRLGGLVLFSVAVSVLLLAGGGYFNVATAAESFSTPWFRNLWPPDMVNARHIAGDLLLRLFASGERYNSPLWTIETELYGSFVTFGFLLLFRKSRLRWLGYAGAMIYFRDTFYQGFILGLLLADGTRNFRNQMETLRKPLVAWTLLLAGLFLASWPAYVPEADLTGTIYGLLPRVPFLRGGYSMMGAGLIFLAVQSSPGWQGLLAGRWFAFCGRISYSVYALHFLLLGSAACWLFLYMRGWLGYDAACLATGLVMAPVLLAAAYGATVWVDEPATRAANRIGELWRKSTEAPAGPAVTEAEPAARGDRDGMPAPAQEAPGVREI